ncbi:MAG TPA: SDR family NAD(P)-dependent oxidoreductase, partial [Acidimicrobiia bacterium]|nr:SDR family NAD(P)-dependent oxidoreductase [Acidimicrobiia bacterium]
MILDGKTVVVTGVGPGLGGEVAKLVLRDGGNVVLAARTADKLEGIAQEVDPTGARVAHQPTDIGDAEQCRALAELAVDRFGAVDGVV